MGYELRFQKAEVLKQQNVEPIGSIGEYTYIKLAAKMTFSWTFFFSFQGFLAIWHGWSSGYYLTFFIEFLCMNFEKGFFPMVDNRLTYYS